MAKVSESTLVAASLAETWDFYFDPRGWPAWVDQLHVVARRDESYPEAGSRLRWRSVSAGRGEVDERVLEHEPRRRHRIAFSDPDTEGELTTTFAIEGESTRVTQQLEYRLRRGGPLSLLTDLLFVRSQQRRSLERSLVRLRHELEEAAG
jgi:hypothetical protein